MGEQGECLGTPFHAQQVDPDKLGWAIAALTEGLGIRAVAHVFAVDPNTVLGWLVEAAEHLEAFSRAWTHPAVRGMLDAQRKMVHPCSHEGLSLQVMLAT